MTIQDEQMEHRRSLSSRLRDATSVSMSPFDLHQLIEEAAAELSTSVKVKGVCPGCGATTLFVGNGGYVTCSLATCGDPTAAHRLLESHDLSGAIIAHENAGRVTVRTGVLRGETVDGPVGAVGKPPAQYVGKGGLQPFEIIDAFGLDFYEGNALKYLLRWRKKNGLEDLRKAAHYIDEVIARAEQ